MPALYLERRPAKFEGAIEVQEDRPRPSCAQEHSREITENSSTFCLLTVNSGKIV